MSDSAGKFLGILRPEGFKTALIQSIADLLHQLVVEIQVVHDCQAHGKHFLCHKQVPDIGTAVAAADGAVTVGIDGPLIQLVLGVFQIDGSIPGKQSGMPGVSRRHDTVEEINAPGNGLDDIGRSSSNPIYDRSIPTDSKVSCEIW